MIQGTNIPIQLTFDSSVSGFKELVATLWISNKEVKRWTKDDMTISGTTVTLPLDEDETRNFKVGKAKLEVKGLNGSDQTVFWEEAEVQIEARKDRLIDLVHEEE